MKTEEGNPNRHMGKATGYDLKDGEYHIAPVYVEQFEYLDCKAKGIDNMLAMVTRHASEDLETLSKEHKRLFKEIADDIGINLADGWMYNNGVLRKQKPETA